MFRKVGKIFNKLSREQVDNMKASDVYKNIGRKMQNTGYKLVFNPEKSQGSYFYDDVTNQSYLDFHTSFASQPLTYGHKGMKDVEFKKKMDKYAQYNPANPDIYTLEQAQFVTTLERVAMPDNFNYLFLVGGGSGAIENALKVAFDWKYRKELGTVNESEMMILHFKGAFHGRFGYSISLTNTYDPNKYKYFPKFNWPRVLYPYYHNTLDDKSTRLEREEKAKTQIIDIFKKYSNKLAAVIIEPIQCEGGDRHLSQEFWEFLRDITNKHDTLFIADEIQTGLSLTGKFWAYQWLGSSPDIITFGKKFQTCGLMCNTRISSVPSNVFNVPSRISSTFGDYLSNMIRGTQILKIVEQDNLTHNALIKGSHLLHILHDLEKFPVISNVRGRGLLCAFDLPSSHLRDTLIDILYKRHCLVLPCGEKSIRLRPFLDVSFTDLDMLHLILEVSILELMHSIDSH